jgi:hypothetical protein
MREIKFRVWDNHNHVIIEVGKDLLNYQGFEIMQYTGLKDKNGKEIYEGDIVKTENKTYNFEVIFSNGCFGILDRTATLIPFWQVKVFEVIGNIYENYNLIN